MVADRAHGNGLVEACTAEWAGTVCCRKTDFAQNRRRPCPLSELRCPWEPYPLWAKDSDTPWNIMDGFVSVSFTGLKKYLLWDESYLEFRFKQRLKTEKEMGIVKMMFDNGYYVLWDDYSAEYLFLRCCCPS